MVDGILSAGGLSQHGGATRIDLEDTVVVSIGQEAHKRGKHHLVLNLVG